MSILTAVALVLTVGPIASVGVAIGLHRRQLARDDPRGELQVRRRDRRRRTLQPAAADAALDDSGLEVAALEAAAVELLHGYVHAWAVCDEPALRALATERQGERWVAHARAMLPQPHLRRDVVAVRGLSASLAGLQNRHEAVRASVFVDGDADLAVVGRDAPPARGRTWQMPLAAYWTLERRDDGWIVQAVREEHEGRAQLESEVVATPWADPALGDDALLELADGDAAVSVGAPLPAMSGVHGGSEAVTALEDLALVDARAAPAVVELCARRMLAAWEEAVAGDDQPLRALAHESAAERLLDRYRDGTVRVLADLRVDSLAITAAEPAATPPWVRVDARLSARWYRRHEATGAVRAGARGRARLPLDGELWLTLEATGPTPWRLRAAHVRPRR